MVKCHNDLKSGKLELVDKRSYRTHIAYKHALNSLCTVLSVRYECKTVSAFISRSLHSSYSTISLLWRSYRTLSAIWVRISWYERVSSVKRTHIALVVVMHSLKNAFILHSCYKRHMSERERFFLMSAIWQHQELNSDHDLIALSVIWTYTRS